MRTMTRTPAMLMLMASAALPLASVSAQMQDMEPQDEDILVEGDVPASLEGFPEGPDLEGYISSRGYSTMQITDAGGQNVPVAISAATEIKSKGGFLGLGSKEVTQASLLNGLPVTVETVRWGDRLIARSVDLKNKDLKTAAMIRNATDQQFTEQRRDIDANTRLAEALRGRVANIDQYNIKGTTNVYFDTGKWNLSGSAERELCDAAAQASEMDSAQLLVVGYTDDVGDEDYNQTLSERRASRVVNYLQQKCSWAPYRMLTPTGMSESDPLADNSTEEGRAQNRRVSVNILVSKAVDEDGSQS